MSRIGQGSGLTAPTSFGSKLRRPTTSGQPATTAQATQNQAATIEQPQPRPSLMQQRKIAGEQSSANKTADTNLPKATSSGIQRQSTLNNKQSSLITKASTTTAANNQPPSQPPRSTFLQRQSSGATETIKSQALTGGSSKISASTGAKSSTNSTISKPVSSFTAAVQSIADKPSILQQRRQTLLATSSASTGLGRNTNTNAQVIAPTIAQTSSNTTKKLKESSPVVNKTSSFGFNRQPPTRSTIGGGVGKGNNTQQSGRTSLINPRHSAALPSTSSLNANKSSQQQKTTTAVVEPQKSTLLLKKQGIQTTKSPDLTASKLASKATNAPQVRQTNLQSQLQGSNRTSLIAPTSSSTLQPGGSRISRISNIGKGGTSTTNNVKAETMPNKDAANIVAKKTGPRLAAVDNKVMVSPKLLKQQSTGRQSQQQSKIGHGGNSSSNNNNVPAYHVSLHEKQQEAAQPQQFQPRRSTMIGGGGNIYNNSQSLTQKTNTAAPLDKKPSFDLKTPQRIQLRPPEPIESIRNPSFLENAATPDQSQRKEASALIVNQESVKGNLGDSSKHVKYREPPSEEAPRPQRQTDLSKKQASPMQRPILSAQKIAGSTVGQANLFQRQNNKLADLRQKKTLILQQSHNQEKQSQQLAQLQSIVGQNVSSYIAQDNSIIQEQQESENVEETSHSFMHQKQSKSDVVLNDFSIVDSQLANIKEQLEQSKH